MTESPDRPQRIPEVELDRATDPQYAAVSTAAVLGVVIGALGVTAMLAAALLAVPALAILVSLLAWRQIRRSRGVLVGHRLALAGLLLGALTAALGAGYHGLAWYHEHQMLLGLQGRAVEVVDEMLADHYEQVFEQLPEDFRRAQQSAEAFRRRMAPLFQGAGDFVRRDLQSLQIVPTERGDTLAPAEVRVLFQRRILSVTAVFRQKEDGQWELYGVGGEESFESLTRFPEGRSPPPEPDEDEPPAEPKPGPPPGPDAKPEPPNP